jgi:hypothetical protein
MRWTSKKFWVVTENEKGEHRGQYIEAGFQAEAEAKADRLVAGRKDLRKVVDVGRD